MVYLRSVPDSKLDAARTAIFDERPVKCKIDRLRQCVKIQHAICLDMQRSTILLTCFDRETSTNKDNSHHLLRFTGADIVGTSLITQRNSQIVDGGCGSRRDAIKLEEARRDNGRPLGGIRWDGHWEGEIPNLVGVI